MNNDIIINQYIKLLNNKNEAKKIYNKARKDLLSFLRLLDINVITCKVCNGIKIIDQYTGVDSDGKFYVTTECIYCYGTGLEIIKRSEPT